MMPYAEVIGDPITQSKSPIIHRFWLEKLGIDADYARRRVPVEDLATYIEAKRCDPAWRGCNVTIPHKQAVLPMLDRIDPLAERIGAANIVVREGESLIGHNSDAPGFLEPLRPLLAERHLLRTARILGTGGAARAVTQALWDEGFTLIIAGRNPAKVQAFVDRFASPDIHVADLARFAEPLVFDWGDMDGRLDLVVNTTSLGMAGQPPLALDFSNVPPCAVIYDAVYEPIETPLLGEARARGHIAIDGLRMLVGQARSAFRHFYGVEAPADPASDAALRALLLA